MKTSVILHFVMVVFIELRKVYSLQYTIYDINCRTSTRSESRIGNYVGISEIQCVENCWLRPKCKSVIYKRLLPLCELDDVDVTTLEPIRLGTSCTVITRDNVSLEGTEVVV